MASEVFVAILLGCSSFRGDEAQFRRWVFAIALDKPPGAVKALQRRVLATLGRTLSQEGGGREAPA